jgi:hypothetical protein
MKSTLLFFLLSLSLPIYAQQVTIFSPGVKVGYAFGERGGFIFGIELSLVFDPNTSDLENRYGAVISFEALKNEQRLHLGAQANLAAFRGDLWTFTGLEIGPTLLLSKGNIDFGLSVTPYFGGFIIPYYRLLITTNNLIQSEVGSFIKLHLPIKGKYNFS